MTPVADRRAIADHVRTLFGYDNGGDAPGWVTTFAGHHNTGAKEARAFAGDDLYGELIDYLAERAETGSDVYLGMCTRREAPPAGRRGGDDDVLAFPGAWADLDVRGPNHAQDNLPPTIDAVLDFLAELPFPPSRVILSGGGVQALYLCHALQILDTPEERALAKEFSQAFQRGVIARGEAHDWRFDATADLARVLRPAGTFNWKTGAPVPVRTIDETIYTFAPRYRLADLLPMCAPAAAAVPRHFAARAPVASLATDDARITAYLERVGATPKGDRDNTCRRVAVWLMNDMALAADVGLDWLRTWNARCTPPLDDTVLVDKIKRALIGAERPYGCARAST